jgi:hypothetical protein
MQMTPRDGLCEARGCNRQYDIEIKMHMSSNKEDNLSFYVSTILIKIEITFED